MRWSMCLLWGFLLLTCPSLADTGKSEAATEAHLAPEVDYRYEKGQVIDFLFAIQKPGSEEVLQQYFKEALPVAVELGYQPLPGFRPSGVPSQGNFHPDFVAVGAWPSWEQRQRALEELESRLPLFHHWRRQIWSVFGLSIHEVPETLSFVYTPRKYFVLTAHWKTEGEDFEGFHKRWLRKAKKLGGKVLFALGEGRAPFGYRFSANALTLTEWPDAESFERFVEADLKMNRRALAHVSQFPVAPPPTSPKPAS